MVSIIYSTVLSNSFSESLRFFPISHINNFTTSSLFKIIKSTNFCIQLILSYTFIVGHSPVPLAYALSAASRANNACFSSIFGESPKTVYLSFSELEKSVLITSVNSPFQLPIFPSIKNVL